MRKTILLVFFLLSIIACEKNGKNNNSDDNVLIKGKIGTGSKGSAGNLGSKGISLSDAAKVVVFTGERYTVNDIENNSFSVDAPVGSATALIFVDANNQYIGNLSISGLNILPLVNLSDGGNTVIDLSTLTLYETSVIPANNPIGKEIMINEDDIKMLKEIGSYFESIAKNMDSDNDGILDYFNGTQVVVNSVFNVIGGTAGLNSTPPVRIDTTQLDISYAVRISGLKTIVPPTLNISFTGPDSNPHPDIVQAGYQYNDSCECFNAFFMRQVQSQPAESMLPFSKGIYTFSMDGMNNHTLSYSSISAKYFLLLAVPVIQTNAEGIITRVEIEYMLPDGTPVDYSKYITTLMIVFKNTEAQTVNQAGSIFDTMNKLPDFENVSISSQIKINDITHIDIGYTDLVGNIYTISWYKP
jgi:hypothetical protein